MFQILLKKLLKNKSIELNKTNSGGTPYGPTHVENSNSSSELTKDEYEIARKTGVRLAKFIARTRNND